MTLEPQQHLAPELLEALRRGKKRLHASHRALPLHEKVRLVIEMQGIALQLIARRRAVGPLERQWPREAEASRNDRPERTSLS